MSLLGDADSCNCFFSSLLYCKLKMNHMVPFIDFQMQNIADLRIVKLHLNKLLLYYTYTIIL